MPFTDCLQPQLTPGEKAVVKDYGGWTNFNHAMGLKPYDSGDAQEAVAIARAFAPDFAKHQASQSQGQGQGKQGGSGGKKK
ncbi:hypothetical protein L202_05764 [Cryptococcus amylolentus CBS 6039]|uniref:Uncharacterized protein n=2 Tax=Cryptococcus amylolentus TaxID=104669 RepID=A0A1E3HHD0_9TREE|nr:hypothetical protein L202_05764 [Cryptococcus amylolentus CBS 6039]ODN75752.1 hypothetical protein L202_05764 [Cryptococcus amylolentus CBS 6039]ODN96926.1 hypothetical protein I350_07900 [Cryptococcus amylolentus CBS 6273]